MAPAPKIIDLPVTGGLWLDDRNRPAGYHRASLNVRRGVVRAGSEYDSGLQFNVGEVLPNGVHPFHTLGTTYKVAVGVNWSTGAVTVVVQSGQREVASATLMTYDTNAVPGREADSRRPVSWADLEQFCVFAGPFEGVIGVVQFKDDGTISIGTSEAQDREVLDNGFGAGDDDGPYDLCAPKAIVVVAHQDRIIAFDEDGVAHISNLLDPHAWPTNRKLRVATASSNDKITASTGATPRDLLICQRNALWVYEGSLVDSVTLQFGGTLRQVSNGVGCVGPAALQVVGSGLVVFMSEAGPMQWVAGQEVPMGGVASMLGGAGSISPLFERSPMVAFELEQYRPLLSALGECMSTFSPRERAVTWTYPAELDDTDEPGKHQMRLRYDFEAKAWSIERHPETRALSVVYLGDDQELLLRTAPDGRVYFEGFGDVDYDYDGGYTLTPIDWRIQWRVAPPGIERLRARRVFARYSKAWSKSFEVRVRREELDREASVTYTAATDTEAYGPDAGTTGFTLGTDSLKRLRTDVRKRGLPNLAAGTALLMSVEKPVASDEQAYRFGLSRLQVELHHDGRGAT